MSRRRPTYSCSIEWVVPSVGVIRIHEGPDGQVGDPVVWAATLDRYGETGTIKGVDRPLPNGALKPMCDAMYRDRMRYRCHERRAAYGGGWRRVTKRLTAPRELVTVEMSPCLS